MLIRGPCASSRTRTTTRVHGIYDYGISPMILSYNPTNSGPQRIQRTAPAERNGPKGTLTDKLFCRSQHGHRPNSTPEKGRDGNRKQDPLPAYEGSDRCDQFHIPQSHGFSRKFRPIGSSVQIPDLCQFQVMPGRFQPIMKKTKIQVLVFLAIDGYLGGSDQNLVART